MKKFLAWLNRNLFVKNLILAVCSIIVFIFIANILLNVFTRHNSYHIVPNLSDMTMEQAEEAAKKASLRLEVMESRYVPGVDPGIILTQLPEPGTHVKSGRRILLTVNSGHQKIVRIPYVTGISLRQAKNNLEIAGLEIDKIVYKGDIATNYVLETRYGDRPVTRGSEIEVEQGSGITLIVGMNASESTVIVPKVVGFPYKEAKSRLWEMGLNLGEAEFDQNITLIDRNESRVWKQRPEQGTRVTLGTPILLSLTMDKDKVETGSASSDKDAKKIFSARRAEESLQTGEAGQDEAAAGGEEPEIMEIE